MIVFTVFYVLADGHRPTEDYLRFMRAGRAALHATNPGARYVVITDPRTALALDREFEISAVAEGDGPLMPRSVEAQARFLETASAGDLVVLAGTDCIANRPLAGAMRLGEAFGVTHRGAKFQYSINNVGYSLDHERGAWFLRRALSILEAWPAAKRDWLGDQESWEAALGDWERQDFGVAHPDGRPIHLYPCRTHNFIMPKSGRRKPDQADAYVLHFKGPRKAHLESYVAEHIVGR